MVSVSATLPTYHLFLHYNLRERAGSQCNIHVYFNIQFCSTSHFFDSLSFVCSTLMSSFQYILITLLPLCYVSSDMWNPTLSKEKYMS